MSTETIKSTIQSRYDQLAANELTRHGSYESLTRAKAYFRTRKLTTALQLGAFPPGSKVLEVGCSVGQFTVPLAERGYDVHGVDLSPNAIAVAKQRRAEQGVLRLVFSIGDAERLEAFADNTFDGMVSFSTLRYVPRLSTALTEIRRVLKPGARAVVDFPNRWCPWFYLKPWLGSERHPHDRWFTAREARRTLEEAGFRDLHVRTLLFTPTVLPDRLLGLFRVIDGIGERTPLVNRLAGVIMVSAAKP